MCRRSQMVRHAKATSMLIVEGKGEAEWLACLPRTIKKRVLKYCLKKITHYRTDQKK